jgi:hypothetical protein
VGIAWSLANELKEASGHTTLHEALSALGLCGESHRGCSITVVDDWHRSGAETYGLVFDLQHSDNTSVRLFLKACVALAPGTSVGEVAQEWLRRREVLVQAAIETPRLYSLHSAVFLEEYIPYTLEEAWRRASRTAQSHLARAFGSAVYRLATTGFSVLSLHDVRSRGKDVVVVDFGFDLGPPARAPSPRADLLELAIRHASEWRGDVEQDPVADVVRGYREPALARAEQLPREVRH